MKCDECEHSCKKVYSIDGMNLGEVCAADYLGVTLSTFRKIKHNYE